MEFIDNSLYEVVVNSINTDLGCDPRDKCKKCIQFAIIPQDLKKIFIENFNPETNVEEVVFNFFIEGDNNKLILYKYIDFKNFETYKKDNDLYNQYKSWLETTFFGDIKFSTFNTDITLRTQSFDRDSNTYVVESAYHREFDDKSKRKTPNTHLILYYPILNNCSSDCGTKIKYMVKDTNEIKEIILPADDNVVYCIRDCCFLHMSPPSKPKTEGEDIQRVIVRSYVTPTGCTFEKSLCDSLLLESGGEKQKKRKYKSRKYHTLQNQTKKRKLHPSIKRKSRLVKRP